MNFTTVVEKARQLVSKGAEERVPESTLGETSGTQPAPSSSPNGCDGVRDVIYGRVCTTTGEEPPLMLSSDASRKNVFLFGPDAVETIIVRQAAYNILCSIGRDKDYLYHMVVEKQSSFWLILFTIDATLDSTNLPISPATWDGVIQHIQYAFPLALPDLMNNINTLKERTFEDFEKEAGFQFLECKKNKDGRGGLGSPPYFSYEYFCSLPKPRAAWQVRAFLFCEVRLLKLFTGDGYTCNESGPGKRILEYLGPNVRLCDLDPSKCTILRMNTEYKDILGTCHR